MTGSFFNPGPYAGFLASVWPVALGIYLFKEKIIIQVQNQLNSNSQIIKGFTKYSFEYMPLLGLMSILLVIPASQSRASWLAVMVCTIILLEYKYAFFKKLLKKIGRLKKVLLVLSATIVLGAGLFGIFHFKKASANGRLFIWKVTSEMISDAPVFGVGFDRFKAHYMNYQAKYFEQNGETEESLVADNTYYAFNEGIQFVSENGLIGFFLLLTVIYLIFKQPLRADYNYLRALLKACLLSIFVFGCFSYPTQILPIKLVLIAVLAMVSSLNLKKYEVVYYSKPTKKWLFKGLVLVAGIGVCLKGFSYTQKLGKGFIKWNDAFELYGYGLYQEAIEEYKLAYPAFKNDGDFLMNYGKALTMLGDNKEAVKILNDAKQQLNTTIIQTALGDAYKEVKHYEKAEQAYKHAANMTPSRFYPYYLLAKLFDESNQNQKALKIAKTLLNKDIKIPSTAVVEIQQEMKQIIEKYNEK
ncbi:O-antigen ligase family protein [Aestuariibaculum sp. M13]|uniref:O-antigen ligase family protein n=1 Tax=Aestuariibaculum sp. M13 TaxID=2967132 RepID=UPI002159F68B|nr:O-antigen ligase family protein [Aestuariibaculum sp. M13]MCR8667542.1 O-antigen ligase family protein [Aestuariibaculum sp. M13]